MPTVEQVLNNPLSGREVKDIILKRIAVSLDADTRLADYLAFPSFQFRADLALVLTAAINPEVVKQVTGGVGSVVDNPDVPATVVTAHVEKPIMAPNEDRVEADIGVPVATRDERGRPVEKRVHYTKEQAKRAAGR